MKASYFIIAGCFACMWVCGLTETAGSSCRPEELPCDSGSCVARDQWCDDYENCPDESDEKYCRKRSIWSRTRDPNKCSETHFLCEDGECVPSVAECDGTPDCDDKSDEKNCEERKKEEEPRTRPTGPPETSDNHEPRTRLTRLPETSVKFYDLRPDTDEKLPTTTPYGQNQRPTSEVPERYPVQPPTSRVTDPPADVEQGRQETYPDRQTTNHRSSDIRSGARENKVSPQVPRQLFRRRPLPTHIRSTSDSLSMAQEWLLGERDDSFGWGKDTSRALVALSLSENGRFFHERSDTALMKKKLQILLAVDLIRNNSKVLSLSRLSLYINALMATCQNPRNFHGRDLADELRKRTTSVDIQRNRANRVFINPITYLTLCLVDETVDLDVHNLQPFLLPRTKEQKWRDMQSLSIMAYSCIAKIPRFTSICKQLLEGSTINLAGRMEEQGNFGNVYSTALAVQALLSARENIRWNPEPSIKFLKASQDESGSFGDLLSTYYVLPILAGKTLADLKHVSCNRTETDGGLSIESLRNSKDPMHYVRYSLYFGDPIHATNSKTLRVPVNSNFFDIMRLAAEIDLRFRFQHELEGDGMTVYSISNVPNDAERGIFWQLYEDSNNQVVYPEDLSASSLQPFNRGIQHLIPKAGDHIIFWYRPALK